VAARIAGIYFATLDVSRFGPCLDQQQELQPQLTATSSWTAYITSTLFEEPKNVLAAAKIFVDQVDSSVLDDRLADQTVKNLLFCCLALDRLVQFYTPLSAIEDAAVDDEVGGDDEPDTELGDVGLNGAAAAAASHRQQFETKQQDALDTGVNGGVSTGTARVHKDPTGLTSDYQLHNSALAFIIRRLGQFARRESSANESGGVIAQVVRRKAVFRLFGALVSLLPVQHSISYLVPMIDALYRVSSADVRIGREKGTQLRDQMGK